MSGNLKDKYAEWYNKFRLTIEPEKWEAHEMEVHVSSVIASAFEAGANAQLEIMDDLCKVLRGEK